MDDQRIIHILWSKMALKIAGANKNHIMEKFSIDVKAFLFDAQGNFSHAIPSDDNEICYLFSGEEQEDSWNVFCQIARYEPMPPLHDDHPDTNLRGKIMKFTVPIEKSDNDAFVILGDIPINRL